MGFQFLQQIFADHLPSAGCSSSFWEGVSLDMSPLSWADYILVERDSGHRNRQGRSNGPVGGERGAQESRGGGPGALRPPPSLCHASRPPPHPHPWPGEHRLACWICWLAYHFPSFLAPDSM